VDFGRSDAAKVARENKDERQTPPRAGEEGKIMMNKFNFEEMKKQAMETNENEERATIVALTPLVEMLGGSVKLDTSFQYEYHGQKCILTDERGDSEEVSYSDDCFEVYCEFGADGGVWVLRELIKENILGDPDLVLQQLSGEAARAFGLIARAEKLTDELCPSENVYIEHYGDLLVLSFEERGVEDKVFYEPFSLKTARAVYSTVNRYVRIRHTAWMKPTALPKNYSFWL